MTSEVKEETQWVREAMADVVEQQLTTRPPDPVLLRDSEWGPVPFRSYELTGYRWRHAIKPGVNDTGLHPLGHAVLIAPDESQLSSIIALPEEQREKELMNMTIGKIVEIGPSAWMDEPAPRAFPGEMVVISKFAGAVLVGRDGKPYRMVNADDVYCSRDSDWPKREALDAPRALRREKKEGYDE
jgi:hypothetical protein